MKRSISTLLGAALLVVSSAASAEYPEKPVNFIVPWPPGDMWPQRLLMVIRSVHL